MAIIKALLALVISLPICASAQMVPVSFRDFSGGLNDSTDATALAPNQSPDLLNVVIDDPVGAAKPRNGFSRCGVLPSGNTPTEAFNYSKNDGSEFMILADNTNVYQTQDCISWTRIATDQSSSSKPSFATVRNKLWFVNGSTLPYTWDGATTTILGGMTNTPVPAPPTGRYIEFWRERVWIARTSNNPSLLQWSILTDSAGNDLDPSTGSLSWPASNAVYVDRDGGSAIYGIKAYRDNLYIFKGNGIWRLSFNNDFDLTVRKTLASVGCRFGSSIVELDNLLYFVGPDGIYAFDGDSTTRISDKIYQKFQQIKQPLTSEGTKIWTDQGDFNAGTVSSTSFNDVPGSVVLSTQVGVIANGDFELGTSNFRCVALSSSSIFNQCGTSAPYGYGPTGYVTGGSFSGALMAGGNPSGTGVSSYRVISVDGSTKVAATNVGDISYNMQPCVYVTTVTLDSSAYNGTSVMLVFAAYNQDSTQQIEMWSSTFTAGQQIIFHYNQQGTHNPNGASGLWCIDDIKSQRYFSTGTYTTQTYQAVGLSSWSVFDAASRLNGGSLSYSVRFGSSTLNVSTATYVPINPGALIPAATWQNFIQIRTSFTAVSTLDNTPYLDSLSIEFFTGGLNTQPIYGGRWKNRYWVSATTGTGGSNDIVLVNSRYDKSNWMVYDLKVGPMVVFGDNFYGGASTHSAVNRLDYTTNDAGAAINWYWTSRDETWGQPMNRKRLLEIDTDYRKAVSATGMKIGYSKDQGATFTSSTVDMSGSGRALDRRYIDGGDEYDFRLRFGSANLDTTPTIVGITGFANIQKGRQ